MAFVEPTIQDFKDRFPVFAAVTDPAIQGALDEAGSWVDETWFEADYPKAKMLYAAHVLTLEGQGTSKEANAAALAAAGLVSIKSAGLSVGFSESTVRAEAKKRVAGTFQGTTYGARFLALLKVNQPAVAVTGGYD